MIVHTTCSASFGGVLLVLLAFQWYLLAHAALIVWHGDCRVSVVTNAVLKQYNKYKCARSNLFFAAHALFVYAGISRPFHGGSHALPFGALPCSVRNELPTSH